jgi:fructose-1,6-bisphosphatase/inositol monophosphatase family enzyme
MANGPAVPAPDQEQKQEGEAALPTSFGEITPSLVGLAMKEMVRRAIQVIRNQRFVFDAQQKMATDGSLSDLVTSADLEAQQAYLRVIRNCFPDYGIIAEEDGLRVDCRVPGRGLYFTIDPLDGTRAFSRRQSAGVGTMIALVDGSQVLAAYVGDVMTQEIYGYRPQAQEVHRISEFDVAERLERRDAPLSASYLLLRDQPRNYPSGVGRLLERFAGIDVEGGSIGISFARLWKGEVEAVLTGAHFSTPWDSAPVIGISRCLGYRFLKVDACGTLEAIDPVPPLEPVHQSHHLLVVGESLCRELLGE